MGSGPKLLIAVAALMLIVGAVLAFALASMPRRPRD